jgi:hypothetical protein
MAISRAKAGMMPNEATDYRSYLVRLWRVKEGDRDVWRASLQDPQSGERISFASLDALFAFLRDQTQGPPDTRSCAEAGARVVPGPAPDK